MGWVGGRLCSAEWVRGAEWACGAGWGKMGVREAGWGTGMWQNGRARLGGGTARHRAGRDRVCRLRAPGWGDGQDAPARSSRLRCACWLGVAQQTQREASWGDTGGEGCVVQTRRTRLAGRTAVW